MSRITLDLIRKRSEHNEGEISTLEEISLHQENIVKIELIDKTCRELRILLLQYNLISKIENLGRLKRLEYLNLALNNIEVIENLEGLESLKKLDLTVNFIGDLRGIERLRRNENLEQLILTGNPCADYEGYREYTIATLSQLRELDSQSIERSERIRALQVYAQAEGDVVRGYMKYKKTREAQIKRSREEASTNIDFEDEEKANEEFWKRTSQHTPEDRIAIAQRSMRVERNGDPRRESSNERTEYVPKLFAPDGRPYNVNRAKVSFKLNDEEDPTRVTLDIAIYKYLDTSYVDVDVQPTYVRATIKGKVLQLSLSCEVSVERSTVKRNVVTGNLIITMPRLNPMIAIGESRSRETDEPRTVISRQDRAITIVHSQSRREYLEIGPPSEKLDFSRIIRKDGSARLNKPKGKTVRAGTGEEPYDDNPDVPPLE